MSQMREIKAIIQPFMLEHVLDALAALDDLPGVTISQVQGWGKSRASGVPSAAREGRHAVALKSKIELVVSTEMADRVVEVIVRAARTGKVGDGKVFVYEVAEVVKVRTGERGPAAV